MFVNGGVVPRWEWRTFGAHVDAIEASLRGVFQGDAHVAQERYFLGPGGGNVKVRDDLVDVKVLREVNADGLERWEPVLKASFPLGTDELRVVFDALGVGISAPEGSSSLDDIRTLLDGSVRELEITKRRLRGTVAGCMSEIADVTAAATGIRTFAIESEDAEAVAAAVADLRLTGAPNVSYPRALAEILDSASPRYAVIDVGTNSVKFRVAERIDGNWRPIVDRAEVTRLGEGLRDGGEISPSSSARTADAIAAMVEEAHRTGAKEIAAMGTAGLRTATNSDQVVAMIKERSGVDVEVISGDEEGRLAYVAVRSGLPSAEGSLAVFDTGGGSSQFTFGEGDRVLERLSLPVGAVRYTETFALDRAVSADVVAAARAAIARDLDRIAGRRAPDTLVGMGGAVTNMTAVMLELDPYDPGRVHGATLTAEEVECQIERYRSTDAEGRRAIAGLQPKRAEVILAGACVVRTVMELLGVSGLTVSDRGLRHGVFLDRFG
ncbi:MAG TPA: Ppx/GppA family phosphatase [Actinomycetota bacterium]|nr:Ppx/GppA family phosphatase [Actinomycetota bacterium]